jgi:hypothetical protein
MLSSPSVLERVIQSRQEALSEEVARFILSLGFSAADQQRCDELSIKAQSGSLSPSEKDELDDILTTNDLLMILKSKARLSLKQRPPSAA